MKIAILSMHRVINWGSFLQAYALRQLLLQNGADMVSFIDIKPGRPLKGFEPETKEDKIYRYIRYFFQRRFYEKLQGWRYFNRCKRSIESHWPLLNIDEKGTAYDLAIIGSDEVFNCCQTTSWGYTLQLYGAIPEAKKVVSYAASFGHTRYEQLLELNIAGEIGATLNTLSAISVRDKNSYDIVKKLTGRTPEQHLDPVLIYGYQAEIMQMSLPAEKDYIVIYAYPGRIQDKTEIGIIKKFARQNGKKLISLFSYYSWCDKSVAPNTPFEVLAWFKGADYVITDTFHGTIFSIITHKNFCTLVRNTNGEKIDSLLLRLGLEIKILREKSFSLMSDILHQSINYTEVEQALTTERARAKKYIKQVIAFEF